MLLFLCAWKVQTVGNLLISGVKLSKALTDIPVYTLGDGPLYPLLLTDTLYSVAYRSWFYSFADQYSGILSM